MRAKKEHHIYLGILRIIRVDRHVCATQLAAYISNNVCIKSVISRTTHSR